MQRRKLFGILIALIFGTMGFAASASADFIIEARTAAIRTEGGPNAGGGWNLWSNGRVGQPLRFKDAGTYEQWYGAAHTSPELLEQAIFGLPELDRSGLPGAKLVACPEQRMVARVPEAMPSLLFSTEPITALVFGLEKKPTPTPIRKRPTSTRQRGESTSKVANQTKAVATRNIPVEASAREPRRSESLPAMGETMAMVTGMMRRTRPASSTDMPWTLCR